MIGSYYIIGDIIFYSLENNGLDHFIFWKKIVNFLFKDLAYENKMELRECCYGVDRGRVVRDLKSGEINFFGTPNSIRFLKELQKIFQIDSLLQRESHYYLQKHDVEIVKDCLNLVKIDLRFKIYEFKEKNGFLLIEDTLKEVCVDNIDEDENENKKYN